MTRILLMSALVVCCVAAGDRTAQVVMRDRQFQPATLSVGVDTTVTWTNQDTHDHTVVADDGSFQSPNIPPGATFQHTFTEPGRYSYGCAYHPRMKAVVIVQ